MKITIERDVMRNAMTALGKIVQSRVSETIPVLTGVKIDARGSRVTLTVTDMDIWATTTVTADVDEPGATVINARDLGQACSAGSPGSQMRLDAGETEAKLIIGKARFRFPVLPAQDFPVGADLSDQSSFTLGAPDFNLLFGRCRFAMSTEGTRYYLNGIYLTVAEEGGVKLLRAAATDGHRLAVAEVAATPAAFAAVGVTNGIIIPRGAIQHALRLAQGDGDIGMRVSSELFDLDFGEIRLWGKLVDASFPDVMRVIPRDNRNIAMIETEALKGLVTGLMPFAAIDNPSSKVKFRILRLTFAGPRLEIFAGSEGGANATDEIAIEGFETPLVIGVHAKYLAETLENVVGTQVQMALGDSRETILITCPQESRLRFVVMPYRI